MIIDLHTHGLGPSIPAAGGAEFFRNMARAHGRAGTGGFLPTLFPEPLMGMRKRMSAVAEAMNEPDPEGARILGIHLEGPFLQPRYAGALDASFFLPPALDHFHRLIEGFEEIVRVITIAPELPGALDLISRCTELGIRASLGHSGATFRDALHAKEAGATGVTHIFNAMRGIHHREPGLAGFGLTDPDIYIEVIADGHHLSPWMLDLILRTKNPDRVLLISDSVHLDPASNDNGPPRGSDGRLQGGATALPACMNSLRAVGITREQTMLYIGKNPARYLGLSPSP